MKKIKLDKEQQEAVTKDGNILLIAGAGSGKTFTIVNKIEYLIKHKNYQPEEILVLSFTNKSVEDLKKKIDYNCKILTIHKLAIEILKNYNINYKLVNDNYIYFITNEFFYSLNNLDYIKEILKYFKESNYNIFLKSTKYQTFINTIISIIKIYKTNNLDKNTIKRIYYDNKFLIKYTYIILNIYETELLSTNSYDFDTLIIKATEIINKPTNYKYIIIDEFQDTSQIRFNLINKVRKINNAFIFAVGDDYQSIYHFSGCNLDIFLNFANIIPHCQVLKLTHTYRNSQELINISTKFIMKNKNQIKKELISNKHIKKPIKYIYYINPKKAFNKLYKKLNNENNDLLVLGRNNNDIFKFSNNKNLNYLTVHSAKGLEADNIILINMTNKINGFPNKINNEILNKIHPIDQNILYAEERRLFYVALTRTKNYVYILTPIFGKSEFIKEIKKYR